MAESAARLADRLSMCDEAAAAALHVRASAVEGHLVEATRLLREAAALANRRRELAERAVRPLVSNRVGRVLSQMERRRVGGITKIQVDVDVLLEIRDLLLEAAEQEKPIPLS